MATKKATSTAKNSKASKSTKTTKTTAKKAATVSTADPVVKTKTKVTTKKTISKDIFAAKSPLMGASIAEFIGTFVLAAVIVLTQGAPLYVGLALVGITLFIGVLSGAHLNPLITVGAWAARKINGKRAIAYVIAQALGAMVALVALTAFTDGAPAPSAEQSMYGQASVASLFNITNVLVAIDGKEMFIFFAEVLGGAIFAMAVASVLRDKSDRLTGAFTVGMGLMVALIVAGSATSYISGSSIVVLNPAVALTLGAIDWADIQSQLWPFLVYVVAPIIGGVIGFFVYDTLRAEKDYSEIEA